MKWADLKNKNTDELKDLLAEQRALLQNLRFQASSHQLKQNSKIDQAKKTIARLIFILVQRKEEEKSKTNK
ncbi:MAG: 50S ribosomal protein L29 [Candidatus Magasanikbacteria bacterium CG10_big_fil_rev_8_21_14_0_10_40_10]|uniref:Large ribosomal subunit protein uL29 n=1 Tax=Candidatus Magasanikbacteria bacterium CG10_big_fil_rev_8_21_14_0_10_40_10 TaxID=1974648 RepID=A0A2M6W5A5_9BACT|nr:MAG: 50S ribosomal protein L29 [Candidatus Magasanikbacteria bacterium CG10_big_fil_rev_8_21_14_0_10_40_10]